MILVGLDDTDIVGARGTNQLAKHIAAHLATQCRCLRIVRHQLLVDDRVPFTSKNGAASMWLEPLNARLTLDGLTEIISGQMQREFIPGSDPGLCVTSSDVPPAVVEFGRCCQAEVVSIADARQTARKHGLFLQELGGTGGGVIGALAAVGLAATGNDGRLVHWQTMHGELSGVQPLSEIIRRDVSVRCRGDNALVTDGHVDVGKKLRPNLRMGRAVLFVDREAERDGNPLWKAQKLT